MGSFKTPKNCSSIFSFIWVRSSQPTWAPKPNSKRMLGRFVLYMLRKNENRPKKKNRIRTKKKIE